MELTVSQYSRRLNVTTNTIYKKIKRGVIKTVTRDNLLYVIADDIEESEGVTPGVKQSSNQGCNKLLKIIKRRDKEVKTLHKEIKRLTKKNESVFASYLGQYQKALDHKPDSEDIIVKAKKSKKNKRKK